MSSYLRTQVWNHCSGKRAVIMIFAVVIPLIVSTNVIADGWTEWEPYPESGLRGVGALSKVSPANTSWVHWSKSSQGEQAEFQVTYNDPTSREIRHCYIDNEWKRDQRRWVAMNVEEDWRASAGSISDEGVYGPSETTNNAVTIECFIRDGNHGNDGAEVHRVWNDKLKVFKVGVRVQPANATIWEDNPTAQHFWTVYANGNALHAYKETTYLNAAGDYVNHAPGWNLNCSWKTVTMPSGAGENIQGTINFTPNIQPSGSIFFEGMGDGVGPSGVSQVIVAAAAAAGVALCTGNPYIAAGAVVAVAMTGGGASINIGFAGDAAIQYIADTRKTIKVENLWYFWKWDWQHINMESLWSAFYVHGNASLKGDVTRLGSAKGAVTVGIRDSCILQWVAGRARPVNASLGYGTSKPTYVYGN